VIVNDDLAAERVAAEAWAAGASGVEEQSAGESLRLIIYAPVASLSAVRDAVADIAVAESLGPTRAIPDTDWSEAWKAGLGVISVTPRLRIRPSFIDPPPDGDEQELVIDPGQAFGTGGHASTLLALEWIDALADLLPPEARILDVGTGTGVLALAAALLTPARAVGFDIDPLAVEAARENARDNGLADRVDLFVGPLDAIPHARFDCVVANLLKSEMLPLIPAMAAATKPAGCAVVAGLLEADADAVKGAFEDAGMARAGERTRLDANGDRWVALLMRR